MSARLRLKPRKWRDDAVDLRRCAALEVRPEGGWPVLADPTARPADPLRDDLGRPGLWRFVRRVAVADRRSAAALGRPLQRRCVDPLRRVDAVFDVPPSESAEAGGAPGPGAGPPLASLLKWAEATAAGDVPRGWTPPERAEVGSWLDPRRLRVRVGALVARGELVHRSDRLALVFPALAAIPPDLPAARRAWCDELCHDARARWRLVRVGPDRIGPDAANVRAEIDLTGVPLEFARPLVQLSLEALAWSVEWLLAPLSLVLDAGVPSRTLDRQPVRAHPPTSES